jgi:transmembrane sensor
MEQKYAAYKLADLLADQGFRQWAQKPNAGNSRLWEDFQTQFPDKQALVEQARLLVLAYQLEESPILEATIDQAWVKLQRARPATPAKRSQVFFLAQPKYRVAASLAILAMLGFVVWSNFSKFNPIIYQTTYGQVQTFGLPDGSKVTLNANSRLDIDRAWADDDSREVTLIGEAFFEVAKKPKTKQKFVVNTLDMAITVLGTSFNVSDRKQKTRVVLNEGAITLKLKTEGEAAGNQEVVMQVGELVEFSKTNQRLLKRKVPTENFSSWKDHKLIFTDTPMSEVAALIHDTYGLKVHFEDKRMQERKITGTIPSENLKILLTSLETIFEVKVRQEHQKLIFEE